MCNNLFSDYDYEQKYAYSRYTKCNHFTKPMYLIINVRNSLAYTKT